MPGAVAAAVGSRDEVVGDQWVGWSCRLPAEVAVGGGGEELGAGLAVASG